jgi:hypothetical protein
MKKANLLNRNEMRNILGGTLPIGDDCPAPECMTDKDCERSEYGKSCKFVTCPSSPGKSTSYCYTPLA